jgi:hypothetical protein
VAKAPQLRQAALRFCLLAIALGALLWAYGRQVEDAALPALRGMISLVDANHRIERLELLDQPLGRTLQLTVTRARYVFVGDQLIEPHPTATAQARTLVGALQLTLALVLVSAAAWPAQGTRERLWRTVATALALWAAVLLDIPLLLSAELWRLYLGAYAPGRWSALVAWSDFMLEGGRYLVPIALGLAASAPSWMRAQRQAVASAQTPDIRLVDSTASAELVHPPV